MTASTHRIPQARLRGSDRILDWLLYAVLLLGSAAGNAAFLGDGFAMFRYSFNPLVWDVRGYTGAFVAAAVWQGIVQWKQFANAHRKHSWHYRGPLIASALPSAIGVTPELAGLFLDAAKPWYVLWPATAAIFTLVTITFFAGDIWQEKLVLDTPEEEATHDATT